MTASRPLSDILFDLVRLMPDEERLAIAQGASLRHRMLALASRLGVRPSPDAVRAVAMRFRRARGLTTADDLSAWCADRALAPEDFARLMHDEATLRALGAHDDLDANAVADFLRVAEGAETAWSRARLLRDRADDEGRASPRALLHAWYETKLGRAVPEHLDDDARRRGFDDRDALVAALARTHFSPDAAGLEGLSMGDPMPDVVLRHATAGDVRPDLFAGRVWVLAVLDGIDDEARAALHALRAVGGIVVADGLDDDAHWIVAQDPDGALRARLPDHHGRTFALVDAGGRCVALADAHGPLVEALARPVMPSHGAPVLVIPGAFEPAFCAQLIEAWERGARHDGVVTALGDEGAAPLRDDTLKRRTDHVIDDGALDRAVRQRLVRRVFPAIRQAFQFDVAASEGFRVGCYEADDGGFFRAHRDDANPTTAHRRFALSVNLAQGAYEGGQLVLPEYGARFDAPTGAAVVYSATVLHEVTPVTRGRRFALVGFFTGASR